MNEPLVSVIMNCYNGEKYLKEAVYSVVNQTYKNWEVVFFDNASDDDSVNIVKSINDERINVFVNNNNVPLGEARNIAISKAKGEYITFLDVDDIWFPNKLESQVYNFPEDCVVSYSDGFYINNEEKTNYKFSHYTMFKAMPKGWVFGDLLVQDFVNWQTVMVRRIMCNDKFYFSTDFSFAEDYDLLLRLSLLGCFHYVDKPLVYYRVHPNSITQTRFDLRVDELKMIYYRFVNLSEVKQYRRRFNFLKVNILFQDMKKNLKVKKIGKAFICILKMFFVKPDILFHIHRKKKLPF
ncbi:MAG: glycosyltransferase [Bacteroidales bacterium]|jgi:glycosyltransferase involved in cell wall biosynthesis|nr:glycosyltransferase [Bacteroidales bacterium]